MAKDNKTTIDQLVISNLMQREEGRKVVWDYFAYCGVYSNTFDKDAIKHAHSAGKRDAGIYFERLIKAASPDAYIKMIGENING